MADTLDVHSGERGDLWRDPLLFEIYETHEVFFLKVM